MALGDVVRKAGDDFSVATQSPVTSYPASVAANDILLQVFVTDTSHDSSGTAPTGWTKLDEVDRGSDGSVSTFWKRASGSETGTLTWTTIFAATESGRAIMLAWPGALASGDPWGGSATEISASGTAKDTAASTPTNADCLAIGILGSDISSNPCLFTWDGGITELIDSDTTPSGQNALLGWMTIGQKLLSGTPSTSLGGDLTSGPEALAELLYFLRPAAGGSSTPQALTATVTTTATMVRQVGKSFSATATTTATIVKQVGKRMSATATLTGVMAAIKAVLLTLTATVTTTATMRRSVGKNMTATATTTATMARQVAHAMSATVTTTATITKQIGKTLAATATTLASLVATFVPAGVVTIFTRFFDSPTPSGGVDDGTPGAGRYDQPTPGQERP